ncbi:putative transposase [Staphylococcus aureus subsp. aureus ST772-MRSA-V]|nr:putative transposase [Staphylococcus aureus subsp. aureus ST772-MRSA-V]AJP27584.1 transposase [Staphylococcus aureus]ELY17585.1 transposase [Staphylococcus aureus KT/Y21]OAQ47890.1 transposase [Staphylococcus aureus]OFC56713.1 transposase [Staphylococcus aureus]
MNENSKTLYRDLVEEKIIPEIKEDGDSDLTIEEIDLIGSHLDKEIEDCAQIRKQTRKKELKDETVDAHLFFNFFKVENVYHILYTFDL